MFLLMIPLLVCVANGAETIKARSLPYRESAATSAQYKFAEENKYDDTGPGAKRQEFAYKTYGNLEDALVAYIDDPNTKLPDHERAKVYNPRNYYPHKLELQYKQIEPQYKPIEPQYKPIEPQYKPIEHQYKLIEPDYKHKGQFSPIDFQYKLNEPKFSPAEFQHLEPQYKSNHQIPIVLNRYNLPNKNVLYHEPEGKIGILDMRGYEAAKLAEELRNQEIRSQELRSHELTNLQKLQAVTSSPLRVPNFKSQEHGEFDSDPHYSFSYGVHDKHTGDSKSAHEERDGGTVRGFYTFLDSDGKQRTVHYTADDKQGFRATVERTHTNSQG